MKTTQVLLSSPEASTSTSRSESESYSFTQESHSRALPLSSALLRANPSFQAALKRFETEQDLKLEVQSAFVVPRPSGTPRSAFSQDEEDGGDEWGDDEWEEGEGEEGESEAGDEWEVTWSERRSAELENDDETLYDSDSHLHSPSGYPSSHFSSNSDSSESSSEEEDTGLPYTPSLSTDFLSSLGTPDSSPATTTSLSFSESDLGMFSPTEDPEVDVDETWKRAMRFAGWTSKSGFEKGDMPEGLRRALEVVV